MLSNTEARANTLNLPDYLGDIVQVGIVVEDVQATVDNMKAIFGVDPDIFQVNTYYDTRDKLGFILECVTKAQPAPRTESASFPSYMAHKQNRSPQTVSSKE